MSQGQAIAGLGEVLRDVARSVVGHHGLDSDTLAGKPGERTLEERHRRGFSLVGQDLDVGGAGGIVDTDVDILPAYTPSPVSLISGDAPPDASDLAEFLDIEVRARRDCACNSALQVLVVGPGPGVFRAHGA